MTLASIVSHYPPHMNQETSEDHRYGNRRVPKMYAQINDLRAAIAAEGTPRIQQAWDRVEEHLDFAYGLIGQNDNQEKSNG